MRFSRSIRTVQTGVSSAPEIAGDGLSQSCWVDLPQDILREVLLRIETSELASRHRSSLVACAGVCRSWRVVTMEIVSTPQFSAKLSFPISVSQPGPKDSLLKCFIRRNINNQSFSLFLNLTNALTDNGKFLLAAKRRRHPTYTDYIISLNSNDISKKSGAYVGKLRSNFLGTKFRVFDGKAPHAGPKATKNSTTLVKTKRASPRVPAGNYPVARIEYKTNMFISSGPRRMKCTMDAIPSYSAIELEGLALTQTEVSFNVLRSQQNFSSKSNMENFSLGSFVGQKDEPLVLKNKSPKWHEQLQSWCLNFHGRVTVASVKNFQLLVSSEGGSARHEAEKLVLQFGKVGNNLFTMDYRYPLSAFQAFAICLSSFDPRLTCE